MTARSPYRQAGPPAPLPLRRGRRRMLAIGVPVLLVLIVATAVSMVADIAQVNFPVNETFGVSGGQVTADVNVGAITLRQAGAGGTARLTGTASSSLLRGSVTTSGSVVGLHCPLRWFGNCSLNGTLQVPAHTAVALSTYGGDVNVPDFTGGQFAADTSGGNVNAGNLSGRLDLRTRGGDVSAAALGGSLQAATSGGNVNVTAMTAPTAAIQSSGGDVSLDYTTAPHSLQVSSAGGDVTLVLPPGQYRIFTSADGGSVSNTLGNNLSASDTIIVNSNGGDITIR